MATSDTQICNLALGQIGVGRIADIKGVSQVERDCAAIYDDARDEVLGDFDWAFARAQRTLTRLADPPEFDYAYAYQLPEDCICVRNIKKVAWITPRYEIVGDKLYCNLEECKVVYTKRITDPVKFPAKFVAALANRLSAVLANSVKKDAAMSLKWWDFYHQLLQRNEELANKGENTTDVPPNPYIEARR